jgi:hypothetical protein
MFVFYKCQDTKRQKHFFSFAFDSAGGCLIKFQTNAIYIYIYIYVYNIYIYI